ncbi:sulfate transporter, partial [Trifolium medium]|nr:sulfate transporter [Trifolium medium]
RRVETLVLLTQRREARVLHEEVRVGDIVVSLGVRQEPVASTKAQEKRDGNKIRNSAVPADAAKEKESRVFVRKFNSRMDDVKWAQNGLVATVINGEAVPVVQNRI